MVESSLPHANPHQLSTSRLGLVPALNLIILWVGGMECGGGALRTCSQGVYSCQSI